MFLVENVMSLVSDRAIGNFCNGNDAIFLFSVSILTSYSY